LQGYEVEKEEKKKPKSAVRIIGMILFILLAEAALFLLWAWVSYHMGFSTEVIRTGLTFLYILPLLFCVASGVGRVIQSKKDK
jgi:hypothetical protein